MVSQGTVKGKCILSLPLVSVYRYAYMTGLLRPFGIRPWPDLSLAFFWFRYTNIVKIYEFSKYNFIDLQRIESIGVMPSSCFRWLWMMPFRYIQWVWQTGCRYVFQAGYPEMIGSWFGSLPIRLTCCRFLRFCSFSILFHCFCSLNVQKTMFSVHYLSWITASVP